MKKSHTQNILLQIVFSILFMGGFLYPTIAAPSHGFSVFGSLKYSENFTHFDYTDEKAPKGGMIVKGAPGSFDSINPFIVMGNPAVGLTQLTTARLMDESYDRAGECYAYVATHMDVAPDRSAVTFYLNPKATFSNNTPITVEDVIWSFETLREKGIPMFRTYYKNIKTVEKTGPYALKFTFNTTHNTELPFILGQLPILNKQFYETVINFDKTTLTPGPTSGPYVIESIDAGRSITYKRIPHWWGESVPSQKGLHNFDRVRIDYYMDSNALFEAFKAGKIHIYTETSIKNWMTGYNFPALKQGLVKRENISHHFSGGTYGLVFNTRAPIFQDLRVRKALTLAFDFYWINKNLFYGQYVRNLSYYPNSDFAASGLPTAPELAVLEGIKNQIPSDLLTTAYELPAATSEAEKRITLRKVKEIFKEAGYVLQDAHMIHAASKKPLTFEILLSDKSHEKVILNYVNTLKHIGIHVKVRTADAATYMNRIEKKQFDMILSMIPQSNSLGNEQRDFFGSERADAVGSFNYAGIKNPAVDYLIEKLIAAPTYKDLVICAHALDRVLLFNYYMIPAWHSQTSKIAYWDKFGKPDLHPKYLPYYFENWWALPEKTSELPIQKDSAIPAVTEKPWWKFWG